MLRSQQHQVAAVNGRGQVASTHLDAVDDPRLVNLYDIAIAIQCGFTVLGKLIELDTQLGTVCFKKSIECRVGGRSDLARVGGCHSTQVCPSQFVAGANAGGQRPGHDQRRPAPATPVYAPSGRAKAKPVEICARSGGCLVRKIDRQTVLIVDR